MNEKPTRVSPSGSRHGRKRGSRAPPASSKPPKNDSLRCQESRDAKDLAGENAELRKELEMVRSLYQQLIHEGPSENYEERRVHLLKSQVIQLERQVMLHTEAFSKRNQALLEVENILERVTDQFRDLLSVETSGPRVLVERSQLTRLIEDTEGARGRLYKNVESCDPDRLVRPVRFMGEFLRPNGLGEKDVTMLNICSGDIDHLNLRHVAKLESKLFTLLKSLLVLQDNLETTSSVVSPDCSVRLPTSAALQERLSSVLTSTIPRLGDCCQHLMELSVLVPSAPWPLLKKSIHPEVTTANVLAALPSMPKSRQKQAHAVVDALLKANNYSREVSKLEYRACSEELRFHQEIYELQMEHSRALFDALREAYCIFEKDLRDSICIPLNEVLTKFSALKGSSSEEALKSFLSSFKNHSDKLQYSVDSLQPGGGSTNGGAKAEAISAYETNFFSKVDSLIAKYSGKRKELLKQVDDVKHLQQLHLDDTVQKLTGAGQ